jgi:DNA-binding transcriptional MerR regulator
LLSPKKSGLNGYKTYSSKSFQRLKFILSARQLGFSVRDIEQILDHADQGTTACPMVRNLQEQRLQETEN